MPNKQHFKPTVKTTLPMPRSERLTITAGAVASTALLSLPAAEFEQALRMLREAHFISLTDEAILREMREVLE